MITILKTIYPYVSGIRPSLCKVQRRSEAAKYTISETDKTGQEDNTQAHINSMSATARRTSLTTVELFEMKPRHVFRQKNRVRLPNGVSKSYSSYSSFQLQKDAEPIITRVPVCSASISTQQLANKKSRTDAQHFVSCLVAYSSKLFVAVGSSDHEQRPAHRNKPSFWQRVRRLGRQCCDSRIRISKETAVAYRDEVGSLPLHTSTSKLSASTSKLSTQPVRINKPKSHTYPRSGKDSLPKSLSTPVVQKNSSTNNLCCSGPRTNSPKEVLHQPWVYTIREKKLSREEAHCAHLMSLCMESMHNRDERLLSETLLQHPFIMNRLNCDGNLWYYV